jgi:hypothetical protein
MTLADFLMAIKKLKIPFQDSRLLIDERLYLKENRLRLEEEVLGNGGRIIPANVQSNISFEVDSL